MLVLFWFNGEVRPFCDNLGEMPNLQSLSLNNSILVDASFAENISSLANVNEISFNNAPSVKNLQPFPGKIKELDINTKISSKTDPFNPKDLLDIQFFKDVDLRNPSSSTMAQLPAKVNLSAVNYLRTEDWRFCGTLSQPHDFLRRFPNLKRLSVPTNYFQQAYLPNLSWVFQIICLKKLNFIPKFHQLSLHCLNV